MTLAEAEAELENYGIKCYGRLKDDLGVVLYFAAQKPVFPFASVPIYPLHMDSDEPDAFVNSEKWAALLRRFFPDPEGD